MTLPQDRAPMPFPEASPSGSQGPDSQHGAAREFGTYFLGRYRVVDEIGVGGMASVHLSRMDGPGGFQKWVAIKRIHPHLVEDETFVNMFLDEARVAARISHPNVAAVFELGRHQDTYWIAMEYLHGEPLREVMRRTEELRQPMPPEIACRVIADAAEGLHSAHELSGKNGEKLGLVHRDVTPHNLFVTYDGCTKVVDFGIAKFTSRIANTRAGTLKGKLAYMSPEQVAGEPLDRRTDVFALGVVLWELTTGQRLFRMESDLDTMAKVTECVVPRPSTIVRGYPIDLEKIVMKALAKAKNERYRTARELSRALQSLLMRRGLFVGADEVSAYMQTVFGDRIRKREAHLRWAAEVTQTIDIDHVRNLRAPSWRTDDGSVLTFNSEVQPSQSNPARHPPRPAAGTRPVTGPTALATQPSTLPRSARPSEADSSGAFEDLTTRGRVFSVPAFLRRTAAAARAPSGSFEDDFDDLGDTVVNESAPDLTDRMPAMPGLAAPLPAAGLPPRRPPVVAVGPLPAVVVPPAPAALQREVDDTGTGVAGPSPLRSDASRVRPYPHTQAANFAAYPGSPPSHGPADMQRLFAPPMRAEQPTVTRRSLRRRASALVVGLGSAILGLVAAGVFALVVNRSGPPAKSTSLGDPHASVVLVSLQHGPFLAARAAFASTLATPPPPPPPAPTSSSIPVVPAESIPLVPRSSAPPNGARSFGSTPQSTAGAGSGTLKIICVPGCDQVIDNGNSLGPSPIVRRSAGVGSHRIKLVWGDASKVVSTVVIADQTATVRESHP
jgi:serine/threonine-protein kinase